MAISDKEWFVVSQILVPNPKFRGTYKNHSFKWDDSRPYPSKAEINQVIIDMIEEEDKQEAIAAAEATYNDAMEAGYTHTDGVTYYCNERAGMDLTMITVLNILDPDEPVYVLTKSHGVVEMPLTEFEALATLVGRYGYGLRRDYWSVIMANQD